MKEKEKNENKSRNCGKFKKWRIKIFQSVATELNCCCMKGKKNTKLSTTPHRQLTTTLTSLVSLYLWVVCFYSGMMPDFMVYISV